MQTQNQTLTFQPLESAGEVECPPEDVYMLELVEFGDFHEKTAWKNNPDDPDILNTQSRVTFQIVDWEYDPDVDDRDWNGAQVSDFFVFFKQYPDGNKRDTWRNERSNAFALLSALVGHPLEKGEDINLGELVGRRIKATVVPKQSGWPKITKPLAVKKRKAKKPVEVEEDDDVFDEDE